MILRSLRLQNFGPYLLPCTLDLAPVGGVGERPICLIGALNGSGKTSLLDALQLVLYGARARCSTRGTLNYKDFLFACRNRHAPDDVESRIELCFEYPTATGNPRYRVVRRWWLTGAGVPEQVEVYRADRPDGSDERPDPELTEVWAERVEDLIPLGVSNLFFFDGEIVRSLASADETSPEVRGAIRTMLGLELPDRLHRDLGVIMNRRSKDLLKPADLAQVQRAEETVKEIDEQAQVLSQRLVELRAEAEVTRREQERLKALFVASGGELTRQAAKLEARRDEAQRRVTEARAQLVGLAEGALPFAMGGLKVVETLRRVREEVATEEAASLAGLLEARDERVLAVLARRKVDESTRRAIAAVLQEDRSRHVVPLDGAPRLGLGRRELDRLERFIEGQLPAQLDEARGVMAALLSARREVERLEGQLSAAATEEDVEAQVGRIQRVSARLGRLEDEIARLSGQLKWVEAEQVVRKAELERQIHLLADTAQDRGTSGRVVAAAQRVQGVLGAYQDRLKRKKLGLLEELVTERFRHLARKDDLVHRIEIDADTFNLTLIGQGRRPVDRARMSAGEQQILAVAFLWALSLASERNLPVVIDTPLSRMDSAHRKNLVERYFPFASHQVVLLSTDVEIDEGYHRLLRKNDRIDREYLIEFDGATSSARIRPGYFWE